MYQFILKNGLGLDAFNHNFLKISLDLKLIDKNDYNKWWYA